MDDGAESHADPYGSEEEYESEEEQEDEQISERRSSNLDNVEEAPEPSNRS